MSKDLITEARELKQKYDSDNLSLPYFVGGARCVIPELCDALERAENRIKLLEGAIERQNNTITYLNSANGQGFNW